VSNTRVLLVRIELCRMRVFRKCGGIHRMRVRGMSSHVKILYIAMSSHSII
jgi:hypothetical protein